MQAQIQIQTKQARPFVKWAGGKGQLLNVILQEIPFSNSDSFVYVEPFVGGGAVLFAVLQQFPKIKKAIINDINQDLINAYLVIRDNLDSLLEILCELDFKYNNLFTDPEKRKIFYYTKRDEFNTSAMDNIERAALFIFLNKTCFNGLYRVNSKGKFNVPIGRYKHPKICDRENLKAVSEALQKVEILQGDFEQTLRFAASDKLYYLDPPYRPISETSSFTTYTGGGFDDNEQIRLKHFCDRLTEKGAKWILSNSDPKNIKPDDNFFDDLYRDYKIKRVKAKRYINSKADGRGEIYEILIKNF